MNETSRLERVADLLIEEGVEFMVVGGQAETLFGSPRLTYDVDLCYRRQPQNLERLAKVLRRIQARLRGAPPDVPFLIDARSLELGDNFTFVTDIGDLDMLGYLEPVGTYDDLIQRAERWPVGKHTLDVIALDDLIRIKRHIKRMKDSESLMQLLAIKEVREQDNKR
jgi:predicted nucleotidyltransferase